VSPRPSREARRHAYLGEDADFYYQELALGQRGPDGWQKELALIESYLKPPGRLLDIACGRGDFLAVAKNAGWQVEGLEVNPVAASAGRREHGVAIQPVDFEEADFEPASFDVVTIFQTLDQLTAPVQVLRRARQLLVPGGLLAVTVPNIRSFIVWAVGEHHRHYTPEKMVSLTPSTLRRLLRTSGFVHIKGLKTFGEEITLSNVRDLWRTGREVDLFEYRVASEEGGHSSRQHRSRGGERRQSALKSALRPLNNALTWTTRVLGLGSYMRAYARTPR
jgi:SAM-dependent methyltransferase